jgi:hypothetical protein
MSIRVGGYGGFCLTDCICLKIIALAMVGQLRAFHRRGFKKNKSHGNKLKFELLLAILQNQPAGTKISVTIKMASKLAFSL